jgi:hypothetical protein
MAYVPDIVDLGNELSVFCPGVLSQYTRARGKSSTRVV